MLQCYAIDGDTGHIKMTRVFRTSIITQLNKIKKNFVTPNGKFNQKFYKKKLEHVRFVRWHIYTLFQVLVHNLKSYKSF